MTQKDLQKEIKVQQGPGGQIFILPADILDNTVKAFSVSATRRAATARSARRPAATSRRRMVRTASNRRPAYGDCGLRSLTVNGPSLMRFDLGISKKFDLPGRFVFEFRGEMLNAFNEPYFNPASTGGTPLGFTTNTTGPGGPGRDRRHADRRTRRRPPTSTTTASRSCSATTSRASCSWCGDCAGKVLQAFRRTFCTGSRKRKAPSQKSGGAFFFLTWSLC